MRVVVNNELGYTELCIEESLNYQEDYQINMLRECEIAGMLNVVAYGEDDISRYVYNVSGMQSMWAKYEREFFAQEEIREFLCQLQVVLKSVKQHMLDVNKLLLDPKYIYRKGSSYQFCYYPLHDSCASHGFHLLTEYLVKVIDYDDVDAVRLVGSLHKKSMDEQYDLPELLREYGEYQSKSMEMSVNRESNNDTTTMPDKVQTQCVDIWAQEIKDYKSDSLDRNIKQGETSFKYKLPQDNQLSTAIKESAVVKWWGQRNQPSLDKKEKVKIKKIKNDVWGNWDDLLEG